MITATNKALVVEEHEPFEPDSSDGRAWEKLVAENKFSGFMQSLYWARFKKSCQQTVIQLVLRQDARIIGGCLLYTCPDERKPSILVSPYGPVLPWQDAELAACGLRLLLEKSEEIAQRLNLVSWRIEPRLPHPAPRILNEFAPGVVNLVPAETLILDLSQSTESLLAAMKPKCRYNILLSQKRGVQVKEECAAKAAQILYSQLEAAADRDDFYLESASFFENLISTLLPSGMLKLFLAEHENNLLGALVLIMHGESATYLYGGIGNGKRNLMPGYALQWHAIQEAKRMHCLTYDFYGYDQFQSPANNYSRFSRFKSGFGGDPIRFIGAQDYHFMDRIVDNVIGFFNDLGLPEDLILGEPGIIPRT